MKTSGDEFRDDGRPIGSGQAAARRWLTPEELAPLTQLSTARSLAAIAQTVIALAALIVIGAWALQNGIWWLVVLCVFMIGPQQHALFILNHEAAHYRLLPSRFWNDALGTLIGMAGGVSMHTYRVTHRLHHNHLYQQQDPDIAIHGGYPRGKAYLLKKLAQDLVGWNAWKTYAYFFGSPAINAETGQAINPLNDTSPALRAAARRDRWRVVAFQLAVPTALFLIANYAQKSPTYSLFSSIFWVYIVFWVLPLVTVLQPILRLRAILEHGGVTDFSSPLTAARCNRTTGRFGNWLARALLFPHHVNHHLEHHLYPAVPHYHLPALHAKLREKGALEGAQVCDVGQALAIVFAPRPVTQPKRVAA